MHKVGLGDTGGTAPTVRGRTQGGGNILQVGGLSNITVWFGDVGPFGNNGEEGRIGTHRLPQTDHVEVSAANSRWDVGDAQGRSITGSGRNCWEKSINRKYINRLLMNAEHTHYGTFRKKCFISYVRISHVNSLVSIDTFV